MIIQCLFFADGGLLALGSNIFNIGYNTLLNSISLIYKPIVRKKLSIGRIGAAAVISTIIGLQLGAFAVVLETLASA
jgi:cobalt/nickel transport system permease protein